VNLALSKHFQGVKHPDAMKTPCHSHDIFSSLPEQNICVCVPFSGRHHASESSIGCFMKKYPLTMHSSVVRRTMGMPCESAAKMQAVGRSYP
jgi:hypothetical protein